jgi:hypothetical protein
LPLGVFEEHIFLLLWCKIFRYFSWQKANAALSHKTKNKNTQLSTARSNGQFQNSKMPLLTKYTIYEVQIWVCATTQTFRSIAVVNPVTSVPRYTTNNTPYDDLRTDTVNRLATQRYSKFRLRLPTHPNALISSLSRNTLPGNQIGHIIDVSRHPWLGRPVIKFKLFTYHSDL